MKLKRNIGIITATGIVVANMVGSGAFTSSGIIANILPNSGLIILCWLFGGIIAVCGALCYGELSTRMPENGGEYIFLKKLFHPSLGFLSGWLSFFVGFSVPIALSAIAFSEYFTSGLPINFQEINEGNALIYKKLIAISVIIIFTSLHYIGGKISKLGQNSLTVFKIFIILCIAVAGFAFGKGDLSNISFTSSGSFNSFAFGTAMMMVMFSYSGWNASSYIAGELKNPKKTLPVSLLTGTFIVVFLYVILNIFMFYSTPLAELKGEIAIADKAALNAFGSWPSYLFSLIISLILLSSLSAFLMIGPRVYYAMAKDGLFLKFAKKIHPRYKVPSVSVLIQGLIAIVMVTIGSFEQLLIYIGFALSIFPFITVLGLFKARKNKIGEENAVKVKLYPFVPIFFLICNFMLMVYAYMNKPFESTAAILTLLVGFIIYLIWKNKSVPKRYLKPKLKM